MERNRHDHLYRARQGRTGRPARAGAAGVMLMALATMAAPAFAGGTVEYVYGPASGPATGSRSFSGASADFTSVSSQAGPGSWSIDNWWAGSPRSTSAKVSASGNVATTSKVTITNAMQTYTLTPPASGASFAGGKLVIFTKMGPGKITGNATIELKLDVLARQGGNWEAAGTGARAVDAGAGNEEVEFTVAVDLPATLDSARTVTVASTMTLAANASITPTGGATQSSSADVFDPGSVIAGFSVLNAAGVQVTGFTLKGGLLTVEERKPPPAGLARAEEFYHPEFDHFFITANPIEIANLDSGKTPGWRRTGQWFNVYPTADSGRVAVCRFFSESFAPKSSHFYAPRGLGCEAVLADPVWLYEGDVFYMPLPAADGTCPAGTIPVYRLYNNGMGGAPNHRFTTDEDTFAAMKGDGWIPEGAGQGVGMCSPQ